MKYGILAVAAIAIIASVTVWKLKRRSVLPPASVMARIPIKELQGIIIEYVPIGSRRSTVEEALNNNFHKPWVLNNLETVELMSRLPFNVPIEEGDVYISSNVAIVSSSWASSTVVTVRFLIDREDKLKDVAVEKWTDSL